MGKLGALLTQLNSSLHRLHSRFKKRKRRAISTKSLNRLISQSRDALANTKMDCFFNCFKSEPEIGEVTAVVKEEELPDDLDAFQREFSEFVDDLDLSDPCKAQILNLPLAKKWQIYSSREIEEKLTLTPEYYVDRLSHHMPQELMEAPSKLLTSLHLSLRTQPTHFITKFLSLQGLELLVNSLTPQNSLQTMKCVKSLMNNSKGRKYFLSKQIFLEKISELIAEECAKTKTDVYEVLGAVCLVPGGHGKVLRVVRHMEVVFGESRGRFQTILLDLSRATGPYKTNIALKTAIMSFLNAILNYGSAEESLEFRLHLRYELLLLGIDPILTHLEKYDNEILSKHIDFFNQMRKSDEVEWSNTNGKIPSNIDETYRILKRKLTHTTRYKSLESILASFMLINDERQWPLVEKLVASCVVENFDLKLVQIELDKIFECVGLRDEVELVQGKLGKVEAELVCLRGELRGREEELRGEKGRRTSLEVEVQRLKSVIEKGSLVEKTVEKTESFKPVKPEVKTEVKTEVKLENKSVVQPLQAPATNGNFPTPPPPPPPPMLNPIIPPPPPLFNQKNKAPTPTTSLKSFNWHKLPKTQNTIWEQLKEDDYYSKLNLENLEILFSTANTAKFKQNTKKSSIIDPRRAQNCNILLSKLKLSDEEICDTIKNMDVERIALDMLEQLLKFLPSNEEIVLLEEQSESDLTRADLFLYKLSRINNFEEKLRVLHYLKKFKTTHEETKTRLITIKKGCSQVKNSQKLKKLLEIVLALGNYMNKGIRGNATGFKLASLNRLKDTKGLGGVNLMSFLAEEVFEKFVYLIDLESELTSVKSAAKFQLNDLEIEVRALRKGLEAVGRVYGIGSSEFGGIEGSVGEVEGVLLGVKGEFHETLKHFGEENGEEFFPIFEEFISNYNEAINEVRAKKLKAEQEVIYGQIKKETKQETLKLRKNSSKEIIETKENGEFDDLISALRTGDVFTDQVLKKRATRKSSTKTVDSSRERSH